MTWSLWLCRTRCSGGMKELHIEGQERPYFISYKIVDRNIMEAHASLARLPAVASRTIATLALQCGLADTTWTIATITAVSAA